MDIRYGIMPGLAGSDQGHWQTIWEEQNKRDFFRIEQDNWDWPVCTQWVARVEERLARATTPVILIAHSLGCITLVHWSNQHFSNKVAAALLVAPADAELSNRLSFVEGFTPVPLAPLPFPSTVIASTNDIYMSIDRSAYFASHWGSEFVNAGKQGHLNASSGLGEWPIGFAKLHELRTKVTQTLYQQ